MDSLKGIITLILIVLAVVIIANRQDDVNGQDKGTTMKLYGKFVAVVGKAGCNAIVDVFGTPEEVKSNITAGSKSFQEGVRDTTKYGFADNREVTLKDFQ